MGVFEHFPYVNYHELNLSWILRKLKELEDVIGSQIVDIVARAGVAENAQAISDLTETVETNAETAHTEAAAAQSTADSAASAASAAQKSANTANSNITTINTTINNITEYHGASDILKNGWTPNGAAVYGKIQKIGFVQMAIHNGTRNTIVATLPAGFRPTSNIVTIPCFSGSAQNGYAMIDNSGNITTYNMMSDSLIFDAIFPIA